MTIEICMGSSCFTRGNRESLGLMELRRTIVRPIQRILEEQYLKKTTMRFL